MRILKVVLTFLVVITLIGMIGNQNVTVSHNNANDSFENSLDIQPDVAYHPAAAMTITSNDDFLANGWSGTGIESDPYLLSGMTFIPTIYDSGAIIISHTDAYFQIEDCSFIPDTPDSARGIYLTNVTNGRIIDCTFENSGVLLSYDWDPVQSEEDACASITFDYCTFQGPRGGISTSYDLNTTVSNCDFIDIDEAIYIHDSIDISILDNTFTNTGIVANCHETNWWRFFWGNTVNGLPYTLISGVHNAFVDLSGYGAVIVTDCSELVLANGYLSNTTVGLTIILSDNIVVRDCDFVSANFGILVSNLPVLEVDSCSFSNLYVSIDGQWSGACYIHDSIFENNDNPLNLVADTIVFERNLISNQIGGVQISGSNPVVKDNIFQNISLVIFFNLLFIRLKSTTISIALEKLFSFISSSMVFSKISEIISSGIS